MRKYRLIVLEYLDIFNPELVSGSTMITWKFDPEAQTSRYQDVKEKLKTGFYQSLKFYVLPFMPQKFRNRVVFLPEKCEPESVFKKHRIQLEKLEADWNKTKSAFLPKLKKEFPRMDSLQIIISPSLFGTLGSYKINDSKITLFPRFDRTVEGVQKLLINTLTHYFYFGQKDNMDTHTKLWEQKQILSAKIQEKLVKSKKTKGMLKILDSEFAGRLAQQSAEYLVKLGFASHPNPSLPSNLSKNELKLFNLLVQNQNHLITFDQIADTLWKDNPDKFSEYAITKLAERLKRKLPKYSIHPQRGVGYILLN